MRDYLLILVSNEQIRVAIFRQARFSDKLKLRLKLIHLQLILALKVDEGIRGLNIQDLALELNTQDFLEFVNADHV